MQKNLAEGTIWFKGGTNDKNNYRLTLRKYEAFNAQSSLNGRVCIHVERDFQGTGRIDVVPSGWFFDDVDGNPTLCIDGGQAWYVYPTQEAWSEIRKQAESLQVQSPD